MRNFTFHPVCFGCSGHAEDNFLLPIPIQPGVDFGISLTYNATESGALPPYFGDGLLNGSLGDGQTHKRSR